MKAIFDTRNKTNKIDRHIYGHFSEHLGRCVYGGYWVGEDSAIPNVHGIRTDIIDAMKAIKVPNIRWPGGCFADDYHWMDGIGPKEDRSPMINTHWGGTLENNHFGTHEFMELCERVGCEPYICGNVGSGTVREMRDWVEYITDNGNSPMAQLRRKNGRDKAWGINFFGIGNENWGCGGFMKADYYANEFRRYATYVKNYAGMGETNWWQTPPLIKIAGGANAENLDWTETLIREAGQLMGGLSVHCYVKPGEESSGTVFSKNSWYETAVNTYEKEPLFKQNMSIMDYYDPEKKVAMAVDEWGIWVDNEPDTNNAFLFQQNTMRSAMSAALMLHIFQKYSDRIRLCNLAQTINVLQSIILTEGTKMVKTPTYHVFDLFKGHQDAYYLPVSWAEKPETIQKGLPNVDISASSSADGHVYLTLVNLSAENRASITLNFADKSAAEARGRYISGEVTAHNTFEDPNAVQIKELGAIPIAAGEATVDLPPCAIAAVEIKLG
jgi:alpha-L-arabinofuranosidase